MERLAVDRMLIKLGRYLRCLGFDTTWDDAASTTQQIRDADASGRVFLTRNRHLLHNHPRPARWLRIDAVDPVAQVHEVLDALDLRGELRPFTRCIRCNVALEPIGDPSALGGRLPARVLERYRRFTGCPTCGTVFWRGDHVRNTCRKLDLPDASEPPS